MPGSAVGSAGTGRAVVTAGLGGIGERSARSAPPPGRVPGPRTAFMEVLSSSETAPGAGYFIIDARQP
ncbi:hypothetical protein, partial [Streptomyces sp. NPDC031705]|uniref:hypothetical protein n=1 Tax=Streptomyces sp. NPDC031705 TaxID=3155729 RepID=UPI0033CB21D2